MLGDEYNNADFVNFSRGEWSKFLSGWRDGEAKKVIDEKDLSTLIYYLPIIMRRVLIDKNVIWFHSDMTPEQCVQAQLNSL